MIGKKHLKIGDAIIRINHVHEYQAFIPVNGKTRAGTHGKALLCPECREIYRVGHFNWYALECLGCKKTINKNDYYVEDVKNNKGLINDVFLE